jgi:hypothetical protein
MLMDSSLYLLDSFFLVLVNGTSIGVLVAPVA